MQVKQRAPLVCLLLIGGLFMLVSSEAATATGRAEATILPSVQVAADAKTQWMLSSTVGVLTLSIPGAGGLDDSEPKKRMTLTLSGEVVWGSPMVFSASDSGGLAALIAQLATSGGSVSTSGTLSGMDVKIVVLEAAPSGDGGAVTAIVSYN